MPLNLMTAHNQWANRPADERFWSLGEMLAATRYMRENSRQSNYKWADLTPIVAPDTHEPALANEAEIAPRKTLEAASKLTLEHEREHGDPLTPWAWTAALTRLSQITHADDTAARSAMDVQASRILTLA
jgi:hypothetical protein